MAPRRFVFYPPAASAFADSGTTRYLTANEPMIVLEEILGAERPHERHSEQLHALGVRDLPGDPAAESPLFGDDLRLACREYVVRRVWVDDEHEREQPDGPLAPLGNAPPRALARRSLATDRFIETIAHPDDPTRDSGAERLYLFNVIVALEWVPTPQRLRRLQWAFRRASDNLYDVTNGGMAFGQVVFAGPDWMHCADIQILASNRFLPRSWVSGLLEPHKYTPIRLGRGLWVRDRSVVIDWDEPEGYRSIVHEWGHYALGLKDAYMRSQIVYDHGDNNNRLHDQPSVKGGAMRRVVVPSRRVKSESIMASVQGNSELAHSLPAENESMLRVAGQRYPGLLARLKQSWSGPGQMPLPMPHFRLAGELAAPEARPTERIVAIPFALDGRPPTQADAGGPWVAIDHSTIPTGRWEVFLMRFDDEGDPQHVSAQGEIDARSPEGGFTLLGARPDDTLVLFGSDGHGHEAWSRRLGALSEAEDQQLVKLQWERIEAAVAAAEAAQQATLLGAGAGAPEDQVARLIAAAGWAARSSPVVQIGPGDAQPADPPDIVALPSEDGSKRRARVRLERSAAGAGLLAAVFGLDGARSQADDGVGQVFRLPSLDGYVVSTLRPEPGQAVDRAPLLISDFSQGGPPKSAPAMVSDPISAGAANGEALILCDVRDPELDTDHYRVVTTIVRGAPLPAGTVALSPVVSVATNIRLLKSFAPTLLIVNAYAEGIPAEQVRICRIRGDKLEQLPTYLVPGGGYAVTPLADGGSALIIDAQAPSEQADGVFHERFVLARVP